MSVTLTMNYKEVFASQTVALIEELLEDSYSVDAILEFIDANSEEDFCNYYQDYVTFGEEYSYGAVDAFVEYFGICDLNGFEDAYRGQYDSKGDYAEQFLTDCYCVDVPSFLEIDWVASFDNLDCVYQDGYVFDTQF